MEVYIPLFILLLLLSAFFASAETAFLSLQRVRLAHLARENVRGAARAERLLKQPRRLLSGVLMGQNLVNTGMAAVGTVITAEIVTGGAGVLAAALIVTVLLVVFGEVGPKSVALHHNTSLARVYALPIAAWSRLAAPAIAALDATSRLFLALIGERSPQEPALSLGELRTAIALGAESGALEAEESRMLLRALRLQDIQVRRVMTPRVNMIAAEAEEELAQIAARLVDAGFLRLPVYSGTIDNIVGYIHVTDANAAWSAGRHHVRARDLMREAVFESERASIAAALETMRGRGVQLLILIDEFGATSGLVTLEDIMEEVVGRIQSESGPPTSDVDIRIGQRVFVEGHRPLTDLGHQFGRELDVPDVETVAGLILAQLRRIPRRGESVEYAGLRLTVMAADERHISLVAVEPVAPGPGAAR